MATFEENVRGRIRQEMQKERLSQRDIAGFLNWSQSRVAKLMTGRVDMSLADLDALCSAVGLAPTEAVRRRGLEFCAEMTPEEMKVLAAFRALNPDDRKAWQGTLFAMAPSVSVEPKGATPRKALLGAPRSR